MYSPSYRFRIPAMTKHKQKEADNDALEILRSTGADVLKAALVSRTAMEAARGKVKQALKCIVAGAEAPRQQERTVLFEKAVEAALEARKDRRTRKMYDSRYFTRRFMKRCPGLARRRVRSITTQECAEYIETAFDTPWRGRCGGIRLRDGDHGHGDDGAGNGSCSGKGLLRP